MSHTLSSGPYNCMDCGEDYDLVFSAEKGRSTNFASFAQCDSCAMKEKLSMIPDRLLTQELVKRLGLSKTDEMWTPKENEFYEGRAVAPMSSGVSPDRALEDKITLGSGRGYSGFVVSFFFRDDKLTGHGVWE